MYDWLLRCLSATGEQDGAEAGPGTTHANRARPQTTNSQPYSARTDR